MFAVLLFLIEEGAVAEVEVVFLAPEKFVCFVPLLVCVVEVARVVRDAAEGCPCGWRHEESVAPPPDDAEALIFLEAGRRVVFDVFKLALEVGDLFGVVVFFVEEDVGISERVFVGVGGEVADTDGPVKVIADGDDVVVVLRVVECFGCGEESVVERRECPVLTGMILDAFVLPVSDFAHGGFDIG